MKWNKITINLDNSGLKNASSFDKNKFHSIFQQLLCNLFVCIKVQRKFGVHVGYHFAMMVNNKYGWLDVDFSAMWCSTAGQFIQESEINTVSKVVVWGCTGTCSILVKDQEWGSAIGVVLNLWVLKFWLENFPTGSAIFKGFSLKGLSCVFYMDFDKF